MQTLEATEEYRITLHRAGDKPADICVITFGGQPSDLGDDGFGTSFCLSQGWDNIYVAQKYGTQYQGLSLERFYDVVTPHIDGQDVVCYGPSLGAYAALYYGGSLDARIVAGAPMFPAWPEFKNKAYADLEVTHMDLIDTPKTDKPPVIIYDPTLKRDMKMVEDMVRPAYPNVREMQYPMAGHAVLVTLQNTKQLKPIIISLIKDDQIIPIKPLEEGSADYHRTIGKNLRARDPEKATEELEKSLAIEPSRNTLSILLQHHIRRKDLEAAQELIDRAEGSGDKNLTIIPSARVLARDAGLTVREPEELPVNQKKNK